MLYPINLNIENMKITIIGGGKVAYRKATNFLDFGKKVTVISNSSDSVRQISKNFLAGMVNAPSAVEEES